MILSVCFPISDFSFIGSIFLILGFAALAELVLRFENNLAGSYAFINGANMETQVAAHTLFFIDFRSAFFLVPFNSLMRPVKTGYIAAPAAYALEKVYVGIDFIGPVNIIGGWYIRKGFG